jgi:flagellar basal-body rod protein FlgB
MFFPRRVPGGVVTLFTDNVTAAIERGLAGVSERQRVTANNLANAETPGFTAGQVDFEANLADALAEGDPSSAAIRSSATGDAPGINGNNVNVAGESTSLIRSGLQYDALVSALNYKLGLLQTAVK